MDLQRYFYNTLNLKNGVLVAHPGLQHSYQLAWSLYERDILQAYWSGIPVIAHNEQLPFWLPKSYSQHLKKTAIPKKIRCHLILFPVLLKLRGVLKLKIDSDVYMHKICHFFDWWVSHRIESVKPKVVVAYENSAYFTFKKAKALGIKCVLDAASFHYSTSTQSGVEVQSAFRTEINKRKDVEIELADLILTCSPLAAQSFEQAGIAKNKLQPVLLGAELPVLRKQWQKHKDPLRFIFAGALSYRKSIDIILSVFQRLYDENFSAQVTFVGGMAEPKWSEEIKNTPNANHFFGVSQTQLFELLVQADCLLLPSRFDSFGMVVAEALACGTPAIVSSMCGSKAIIEKYPGCGWIVEPEAESLYFCVRARIENRAELFAARKQAFKAAEHFTWQSYRKRIGQVMTECIRQ